MKPITIRRLSPSVALALALALAACGSGTVTNTDTAPPHVLSVTVPVRSPEAGSQPAAAPPATRTAPQAPAGPPGGSGKTPPGKQKKRGDRSKHGKGEGGD